jgi:predicted flap endonuclease-1-like 5' DNA nuclease
MRKLVNFILFVVAAVGISWMMREYLVPQPEAPTATPPPFRPAPEPQKPATTGTAAPRTAPDPGPPPTRTSDDLTQVTGIGPVFAKRLGAVGITTFSDLAAADAQELAEKIDVADSRVADWITQAADLG